MLLNVAHRVKDTVNWHSHSSSWWKSFYFFISSNFASKLYLQQSEPELVPWLLTDHMLTTHSSWRKVYLVCMTCASRLTMSNWFWENHALSHQQSRKGDHVDLKNIKDNCWAFLNLCYTTWWNGMSSRHCALMPLVYRCVGQTFFLDCTWFYNVWQTKAFSFTRDSKRYTQYSCLHFHVQTYIIIHRQIKLSDLGSIACSALVQVYLSNYDSVLS